MQTWAMWPDSVSLWALITPSPNLPIWSLCNLTLLQLLSIPLGPKPGHGGEAKKKRGENLAILGQKNYWRDWKGGKQGVDLELGGSLLGKVLSDSERQRPGLGTKPNPKSRLQVLVSKLVPEKDLDAHLL